LHTKNTNLSMYTLEGVGMENVFCGHFEFSVLIWAALPRVEFWSEDATLAPRGRGSPRSALLVVTSGFQNPNKIFLVK
jgi:hypothetical protein